MRVLVFGTFDILHPGHLFFLRQARTKVGAGELVAVVARDSSVEKMKGSKPILLENSRLEILNSIKFIDKAVLGNEGNDKLSIIEELKPDAVFLGYDQWPDESWLESELKKMGLDVKVERLEKFEGGISSSSRVKELIRDSFGE